VDGLQTWNTIWNNGIALTSHATTSYDPAHGYRILTNTSPDGSYTVTTNQNGRLLSVTRRDSSGAQVGQTIYGYDPHGRQNTATDARNGTTTSYFTSADQVNAIVTQIPASGQSSEITFYFFDNLGRVIASKLPDNTYVTNMFDVTGLLTNTFGSRTYPVAYTYDAQGRMKTMKTLDQLHQQPGRGHHHLELQCLPRLARQQTLRRQHRPQLHLHPCGSPPNPPLGPRHQHHLLIQQRRRPQRGCVLRLDARHRVRLRSPWPPEHDHPGQRHHHPPL
jgi:YD repeat-containing protein